MHLCVCVHLCVYVTLLCHRPLLDELVREYSAARGLSDARDAASPCTEDAVAAAIDSVHIADSDQPSTATGPGPLTAASNGDVNERPQHATSTARVSHQHTYTNTHTNTHTHTYGQSIPTVHSLANTMLCVLYTG